MDLCELRGVGILVTTHGRIYDPTASARDRRSLLDDAVDSEYESAKVSQRARRAAAANAAAGKPHGQIPFGYRRRYDPVTRALVAQEPDPVEAPVVRELFARLQQGHSLRSIAKDFEARGVRNKSGRPFSAQHLRDMALKPAYAGMRTHTPGARGQKTVPRGDLSGAVKGNWESLVDEATFLAVRRQLTAPERTTTRPGAGKHLLSMIAKCAECEAPLAVTTRGPQPEYQCHHGGCVRVRKAELDELAEGVILVYLARDDVYEAVCAASCHDDAELAEARAERARADAELRELRAAAKAARVSIASFVELEPAFVARLKAAETRERELSTPPELAGLISPGKDVARRWKAAEMSTKRAVARILLSPGLLGELHVRRRPEGRRNKHVPVHERVEWRRETS